MAVSIELVLSSTAHSQVWPPRRCPVHQPQARYRQINSRSRLTLVYERSRASPLEMLYPAVVELAWSKGWGMTRRQRSGDVLLGASRCRAEERGGPSGFADRQEAVCRRRSSGIPRALSREGNTPSLRLRRRLNFASNTRTRARLNLPLSTLCGRPEGQLAGK